MYRIFLTDLTFVYTLNRCKVRGGREITVVEGESEQLPSLDLPDVHPDFHQSWR